MTTFQPIYRATVYADEAMSTPLTPASGAPHSDSFQVATATGVTGYQPYLGIPQGPRGEIDPMERTVSTGQLTLRLLDQRTTEGGSNLSRWVTAFVGDADGDPQLGGRLVVVEESTDGGSSWSDFFTGRIHRTSLDGRLEIHLAVRDRSEDLDRTIFVGRPHASASGFMPSLWPVGLTQSYGALPTVDLMSVTFRAGSDQFTQNLEVVPGQNRNVMTQDLVDRLDEGFKDDRQIHPSLRIRTATGDEYRLQLLKLASGDRVYIDEVAGQEGPERIERIGITELPADDPNHAPLPADGATLSVEIIAQREPGEGSPILVDDVHPAQILKEVAQGHYGYLGGERGAFELTVNINPTREDPR